MSQPGVFDLSIYRGDTYGWRFMLWEDEAKTMPFDLTGADAAAEVRRQSGGEPVLPMTVTVTLPNTIDVTLPADESALLPTGGNGVWDLQLTWPVGNIVRTVVRGSVNVTGDVTDSTRLADDPQLFRLHQ